MQLLTPREWRLSEQRSLAAVAREIGVEGKNPARTYQRWEAGESDPPLKIVSAIESLSTGKVTFQSWVSLRERANAPKSPSVDNRADRASRSDQRPTRDTARSLEPGEAGALSAPAPGDVDEHSLQDPSEVRA